MKTRISGKQYLAFAMVMLIVAVGAFAKVLHDTTADVSANMAAVHADYDAIRATTIYRATSARERPEASEWTACAGVQDSAVQVIERVQTQIGIVFLSSVVNVAIADGCAIDAQELVGGRLEEAFDARADQFRWPWFASVLVAANGGSIEAHQGLRDALLVNRKVAVCIGDEAQSLRRVSDVRPAAMLSGLHQECENAVNGAGNATHPTMAQESSRGLD